MGVCTIYIIEKLLFTGFKKLSLQTTFWLSLVYRQKLDPMLQSMGFENVDGFLSDNQYPKKVTPLQEYLKSERRTGIPPKNYDPL